MAHTLAEIEIASGDDLDRHGESVRLTRLPFEPDDSFRNRILFAKQRPFSFDTLDTASLDQIGTIVGIARYGFERDDDFRARISAYIGAEPRPTLLTDERAKAARPPKDRSTRALSSVGKKR